MADYVGAIDQGTTSTRFMIFDHAGTVIGVDQKEHEQIFPQAGWVEHNAKEIWENTRAVSAAALGKVSHPLIAALHDAGERDRQLFYNASELITGPKLSQKVGVPETVVAHLAKG